MRFIGLISYFLLLAVTSSFASETGSTLDLRRYWIQDRFIRTVTFAKNDQEKLLALNALMDQAKAHKQATPAMPEVVVTIDDLTKVRFEYLHPKSSIQDEVSGFLQNRLPPAKLLAPGSGIEGEFNRIAEAYKRLMDIEFAFPPKGMMSGFLRFVGVLSKRNVTFFDLLFENSKDSWLAVKAMQQRSDQEKLQYLNKLQSSVHSVAKTIRSSGGTLLENTRLEIKDPRAKRFMELLLTEYFSQLPETIVWKLIFLQMERPELETVLERFQLFSRNVGPHLHKLFQMISTEAGVPVKLTEILKTFQEDLPPAHPWEVADVLQNLKFNEFEILELEKNPVKVGSMAQVHKAKAKFHHDGQERMIAVRLIKPGVEAMVDMDERFLISLLDKINNDPILTGIQSGSSYSKIISDLIQLVREELNARTTQKNQNQAVSLLGGENKTLTDGTKLLIEVPVAYMSNKEGVIASDWVDGVSLVEFYLRYPEKAREVAELLFSNWMEKAILTTGFVHADMQPGNIKVDANLNADRIKAHIIDYGMAGVIGPEGRELFMLMAIGATLKSSKALARSVYLQANNKDKFSFEQVEAMAETFLQNSEGESLEVKRRSVIERSVGFFVKNGIELDANFILLARGFKTAHGLLDLTKSSKKPSEMLTRIFQDNPALVTRAIRSIGHLSLAEAGGLIKDGVVEAGSRAARTAIENPQAVVYQGKKIFSLGRGLFERAKSLAAEVNSPDSDFRKIFEPTKSDSKKEFSFKSCIGFYGK